MERINRRKTIANSKKFDIGFPYMTIKNSDIDLDWGRVTPVMSVIAVTLSHVEDRRSSPNFFRRRARTVLNSTGAAS
jgi:hypothetical protein